MKPRTCLLILLLLLQFNSPAQQSSSSKHRPSAHRSAAPQQNPNLKLWYKKPAAAWEAALPLGNGKTGAMVFGNIVKERYQLNDNTLWSGYPDAGNNANGPAILPQVRKAVFDGEYDKAAALWKNMQGPYSARYLPLADLWLDFKLPDSITTTYHRELDLNNAISKVVYTVNGITYERETFISYPDQAMIIRITADKPGAVNFSTSLSSKLQYSVKPATDNYLVLSGKAPKYVAHRPSEPQQVVYDDEEGMKFQVHVKIKAEGGKVAKNGTQLTVSGASSATIYLTEATSFNGFDHSPGIAGKDPAIQATANMNKAVARSYQVLKQRHIADVSALFNRVSLQLEADPDAVRLPTDERLQRLTTGKPDHQLEAIHFQFGRYLLIAASRPGSRPTNLQGIWNDHVQPPWGSNYTTNINTEMNYWLAENTNLSECHQPLFNFIKELATNGAATAKTNYDIHEGWVAHHNSDLWAKTSPPGGYEWDKRSMARWSCWPMAGAWFSTHLWEHYLFTGDRKFLREEAYPLMKGAALFMLHWLQKDPATGYLITIPSSSPENTMKVAGKECEIGKATTMDMSIIRELFAALIKTSEILQVNETFRNELKQAYGNLYPYHIGKYGQLQEWYDDLDDPNDKHRHISHLFGLYPGSQLTPNATPELTAAARQTLVHRGDVSTGWSMAWKVNWWARLQDGDHAYKVLKDALNYVNPEARNQSAGGAYPNLFDACPPFQIDGNFGATAGITEMLLQSHDGAVHLLPALPDAWKNGAVRGIKARGNFTVDIQWNDHLLQQALIRANLTGPCTIRTALPVRIEGLNAQAIKKFSKGPNNLDKPYYEIFFTAEREREYKVVRSN